VSSFDLPAEYSNWSRLCAQLSASNATGRRSSFELQGDGIKRTATTTDTNFHFLRFWENWEDKLRPAILEQLKDGCHPLRLKGKVHYLWAVDAPEDLCAALDRTPMGRLHGPGGLCSVDQWLPSDAPANYPDQLPWRLFIAPPLPSVIFTPPHADGFEYKSADHFVLPCSNPVTINSLVTWNREQWTDTDGKATREAQEQLRIDERGGSLAHSDSKPWDIPRQLQPHAGQPFAFGQLQGGAHSLVGPDQVVFLPPGCAHLFVKQLALAIPPPDAPALLAADSSAAPTADAPQIQRAIRGPPIVGVSYDSLSLGCNHQSATASLRRLEAALLSTQQRVRDKSLSRDSARAAHVLPFHLLLAQLAEATPATVPHVIQAIHVRAAEPFISSLIDQQATFLQQHSTLIHAEVRSRASAAARWLCAAASNNSEPSHSSLANPLV